MLLIILGHIANQPQEFLKIKLFSKKLQKLNIALTRSQYQPFHKFPYFSLIAKNLYPCIFLEITSFTDSISIQNNQIVQYFNICKCPELNTGVAVTGDVLHHCCKSLKTDL